MAGALRHGGLADEIHWPELKLAAKITDEIAKPCRIGELEAATSASMGVAVYPEDGRFPNELLRNADVAMYAAKKKRNSFAFYRELVEP